MQRDIFHENFRFHDFNFIVQINRNELSFWSLFFNLKIFVLNKNNSQKLQKEIFANCRKILGK